MGKVKTPACQSSFSQGKTFNLSRCRRRASQTKHRHQVASCYQRLRRCIPSGNNMPRKSCQGNRKVLNKVAVLNRSKEYILHLENVLRNLLAKKTTTLNKCQNYDNMIAQTIRSFDTVEAFRAHFGSRFEPQCEISAYFDDAQHAAKFTKWLPSRKSSQCSEDLGFVSGEGSSQERCSNKSSLRNSQELTSMMGKQVPSYPQGASFHHSYRYPYGVYPSAACYNSSPFVYYIPAVHYQTPFYTRCNGNMAVHTNSLSGAKDACPANADMASLRPLVAEDGACTQSSPPVIMPGNNVTKHQTESVVRPNCSSATNLSKVTETTTMPRLEMRYSYSKAEGKMSPPKICLLGQAENSKSPPTLVVVEKTRGEHVDDSAEYYSCLLSNSQ